jgi:hypothetical protein
MQVLNRLDATMAKLDQIRKDLEWLKEKKWKFIILATYT